LGKRQNKGREARSFIELSFPSLSSSLMSFSKETISSPQRQVRMEFVFWLKKTDTFNLYLFLTILLSENLDFQVSGCFQACRMGTYWHMLAFLLLGSLSICSLHFEEIYFAFYKKSPGPRGSSI